MAGLRYAGQLGGKEFSPNRIYGLMGYSENGNSTGSSTYLTGQIWAGDLLVLTTYNQATSASGTLPVVRQLNTLDQSDSSHYYTSDHSTGAVAGVYGVSCSTAASNSTGQHQTPAVQYSAAYPYPYSEPMTYVNDPTSGHGVLPIFAASANVFAGRIYGGTTRMAAALQALPGTLGGITLLLGTGTNGIPAGQMYYAPDVNATAAQQIIRFIGWNTEDPYYASTLGLPTPGGFTGSTSPLNQATPEIFFVFVDSFCQSLNGVPYSVQIT